MRCQRCGNEVQPEEAFCGHCGAATSSTTAYPHGIISTPPSHNSSLPDLSTNAPFTSAQMKQAIPTPENALPPQQIPMSNPSQLHSHMTGFYYDATQAINVVSDQSHQIPAGYTNTSGQSGLPTPHSYQGPGHFQPPAQSLPSGRLSYNQSRPNTGYHNRSLQPVRPSQKSSTNPTLVIVCICLAILIVAMIGFIAVYFTKNSWSDTNSNKGKTRDIGITGTTTPAPAVTPTLVPTTTATPATISSPTVEPTPYPDAHFMWCGPECRAYGFEVEYPDNWQISGTTTGRGIAFTYPAQPDMMAAFLSNGPTQDTADTILNNELQQSYSSQAGYSPPTSTNSTTLNGETWLTANIYYKNSSQQNVRVEIFTTVHQGQSYLIKLQASDPSGQEFNTTYATYYSSMINKYLFVQ